jgi:hypothetical protein
MAAPAPTVKLGIDLFSLRSQNGRRSNSWIIVPSSGPRWSTSPKSASSATWNPKICGRRSYAEERGIEIEIGMRSICPTSKMFDAKAGTAEEQIATVGSATLAGSPLCAPYWAARGPPPQAMKKSISKARSGSSRNVRAKAQDHNLKIAIENHSGDMQAHELKQLIEESGGILSAPAWIRQPLWRSKTRT